jgi:4-alpha-glucanotransferase
MPFEAMLAIAALESVENCCVLIGEDLGTVPEGFRDALARWGIWSYRVMMFEQDYHSKAFFAPDAYPSDALVTFSTHDLPTFEGWHSLSDLALKRSLGIDPGENEEGRRHAVSMLHNVLREAHIQGNGFDAIIRFLARTPSRLLAISLEDLLKVVDQPNIPGTVDEYPNWRQRLPVGLEEYGRAIGVEDLRSATAERASQR